MTYGPDAIHELIEEPGWSYPVAVRRPEREHGVGNIHIDTDGHSNTLVKLLADGEVDSFADRDDLEHQLTPVFEAEPKVRRTGGIGTRKVAFLGR